MIIGLIYLVAKPYKSSDETREVGTVLVNNTKSALDGGHVQTMVQKHLKMKKSI